MKSFFSGNQHQKSRIKKTIFGRNFFLGIIILLVSIGCKKSNRHYSVFNNFTFSKEALDYIKFNPGKYFIYKDSATLTTDSVVVTESLLDTVSGTEDGFFGVIDHYTAQEYTLILSKIDSSGATVWVTGKASSLDGYTGNVYLDRLPTSIGGYLFRYPPGGGVYQEPCNCVIERNIPAITVEGDTYTDVVLTVDEYSASKKSSYYWAKEVGLIKRSEVNGTDTKTYTLLRHN
jgi:hypothetical protein